MCERYVKICLSYCIKLHEYTGVATFNSFVAVEKADDDDEKEVSGTLHLMKGFYLTALQ